MSDPPEVLQLIETFDRKRNSRVPDRKTLLQRQIDTTNRQIDQLVYELYNLTPQESKIIEDATEPNK